MGLWCLKVLFFLFVGFSIVGLIFGIYTHDGIIIAIGILFILAAIIIALELKQLRSGPFHRD
ncbi:MULTISPECIES: hypothetical protein [unclassified Acinetobacter]|uniref:hypothetical protein n=1 Tax=unclassified Acinetobacter TaxID=196816 RepID=UPI0021B7DCCA|nr:MULTISPECIES: hypothetical protein [unclassified Acinetobacter]MCT8088616.1 hypothetical protein [Acinetobacter sp. F_3_1]MCT8096772.1 hypothetical protein [Acinetobacter sp. C_3_1]MCT8099647.1 hypothetical protein [Acinetobacter sp. C_4_1]MCT8133615.1 hypothetical protein [Acinetobacter sp. T_3_1]